MESDENQIAAFLESMAGQFVSGREIARRADGKSRFEKDPNWAAPVLRELVEKGIIEMDATGHYRLCEKKI